MKDLLNSKVKHYVIVITEDFEWFSSFLANFCFSLSDSTSVFLTATFVSHVLLCSPLDWLLQLSSLVLLLIFVPLVFYSVPSGIDQLYCWQTF